jgi:hypothetical protein
MVHRFIADKVARCFNPMVSYLFFFQAFSQYISYLETAFTFKKSVVKVGWVPI